MRTTINTAASDNKFSRAHLLSFFRPRNLTLALGLGVAAATTATAGTGGAEFQEFYNRMLGWSDGYLGKGLAILAFMIGAGFGIAKQSLLPPCIGVFFALFFGIGPNLINGIVTATV